MKLSAMLVFLVCACFLTNALARTWEDIALYHVLDPVDDSLEISAFVTETDPLLFTTSPSMAPSLLPSAPPSTSEPSGMPSFLPTFTPRPTTEPSRSPSRPPSLAPSSVPSNAPSQTPTRDEVPPNPIPSNPPNTYFNYDPASQYGPGNPQVVYYNETMNKVEYFDNGWPDSATSGYWNEFADNTTGNGFGPWQGVLARHDPSRNRCGNIGKQSPIDVRTSGAECLEHHQIRSRPGDMTISNNTATTKLIESNKLRLLYNRRPCADSLLPECAEPDPPASDFPHNWGGYSDVMHVDFKAPSEHTIDGERFDGEMQIFHLHPLRRRTPAVSVLIRATDTYNSQLQAILDQFQDVYDLHKAQCAQKIRRERQLFSWVHRLLGRVGVTTIDVLDDNEARSHFSTALDDPNYNRTRRQLQNRFWHPHHPELVPSIYFYGYEGSLTEPPCGEWVSWFVTDAPMLAHRRQVEQLKDLIFTHVSADCQKTSVHHGGSVARPIQDSFGRGVWHCTSVDYPPDDDREK